jgi:hypothetical protein
MFPGNTFSAAIRVGLRTLTSRAQRGIGFPAAVEAGTSLGRDFGRNRRAWWTRSLDFINGHSCLNFRIVIIKTSLLVIIVVRNDFWNWNSGWLSRSKAKIIADGIALLGNLIAGVVGEV